MRAAEKTYCIRETEYSCSGRSVIDRERERENNREIFGRDRERTEGMDMSFYLFIRAVCVKSEIGK